MWWKIVGGLLAIWLAFVALGAIFSLLKGMVWIAVLGGLVFIGVAAYKGITQGEHKQIRS